MYFDTKPLFYFNKEWVSAIIRYKKANKAFNYYISDKIYFNRTSQYSFYSFYYHNLRIFIDTFFFKERYMDLYIIPILS